MEPVKRLGTKYFKKFKNKILSVLKDKKIIKTSQQMVDATVYPANIKYLTDIWVIESARQWVVETIKRVRKTEGLKKKIRTYCWKAKKMLFRLYKEEAAHD